MSLRFVEMVLLSNVASVADYGSDGVPPTGVVIDALVTFAILACSAKNIESSYVWCAICISLMDRVSRTWPTIETIAINKSEVKCLYYEMKHHQKGFPVGVLVHHCFKQFISNFLAKKIKSSTFK